MEEDISRLSAGELRQKIGELENTYAEFFNSDASPKQLLEIQMRIQQIVQELKKRLLSGEDE